MKNLLPFLLLLLFTACKDSNSDNDNTPTPEVEQLCYLTGITSEISTGYSGSAQYVYNANNQIIEYNYSGFKNLYEYNEKGQISKVTDIGLNGEVSAYYTAEYDNKGNLINLNLYGMYNGAVVHNGTRAFEYTPNGQLVKYRLERELSVGGPVERVFTYTNGLMTGSVSTVNGQFFNRETYKYDSKTYYLAAVPAFQHLNSQIYGHPYLHNITEFMAYNEAGTALKNNSYTSSFEYNEKGYPTKEIRAYLNGSTQTRNYTYDCK